MKLYRAAPPWPRAEEIRENLLCPVRELGSTLVLTRPCDSPLPRLCGMQSLSWLSNCKLWTLLLLVPWPHRCKPSVGFPRIHHSAKIMVQSILPRRGQSSLIDNASQFKTQDLANRGLFLRSFVGFPPVLQITVIVGLWNPEAFSDFVGNSWADVSTIFCHPWIDHQPGKHWNGWSRPVLALLEHPLVPSELLLPASSWWLSAPPQNHPLESLYTCVPSQSPATLGREVLHEQLSLDLRCYAIWALAL